MMRYGFFILACCTAVLASAHDLSRSLLILDVGSDAVEGELHLPLSELRMAWAGIRFVRGNELPPGTRADFDGYLHAHLQVLGDHGPWSVELVGTRLDSLEHPGSGYYRELVAQVRMKPAAGDGLRSFTLRYDGIMHQLPTHIVLVRVRRDWEAGAVDGPEQEVGVLHVDAGSGTVRPLRIDRVQGGAWSGFMGMLRLGMRHIQEGVDHLLFLLALLLSAPLVAEGGRWARPGGLRYALRRLLRITVAFTLGHLITLIIGAFEWLRLPQPPVEVAIAFSILVTAVHALRPLFPGREMGVAMLFGLVHGSAFAATLSDLRLGASELVISLLGFNLGIELMQLAVVLLVVPWLLLLSTHALYRWVRIYLALFAAIAACGWILERVTGVANPLTIGVVAILDNGVWLIGALALLAVVVRLSDRRGGVTGAGGAQ